MYPNPALPAWEMAIMAVVPVVALVVWLVAIYVVAREPGRQDLAAAGSPAESDTAGIGSRWPAKPGEREPEQPPVERLAA